MTDRPGARGEVFAPRTLDAIEAGREGPLATGAMRAVLEESPAAIGGRPLVWSPPRWDDAAPAGTDAARLRDEVQRAMTLEAGVVRSSGALAAASAALAAHGATAAAAIAADPGSADLHEVANLVTCGLALAAAADARTESRGNHWRRDHPGHRRGPAPPPRPPPTVRAAGAGRPVGQQAG